MTLLEMSVSVYIMLVGRQRLEMAHRSLVVQQHKMLLDIFINYHTAFPYLFKNAFPKRLSLRNGFLGSTTRAFPGVLPSVSPYMTAIKESVVGSGPIRIPGKSCSKRYLMAMQNIIK